MASGSRKVGDHMSSSGLRNSLGGLFRRSLTDFLPGRKSSVLAVDIGSSCVKLVEADGGPSQVRILAAGIAPLSPTAVQNNLIQEPDEGVEVIRDLVKETGARATEVITAVPGPAVMIKKIMLPGGDEADLDNQVMLEAGSAIPENLDNVTLDYQVIDYTDQDEIEVLLVAVKKDILNSYTSVLRQAGLAPQIVDVDYFALENMFELNYDIDVDVFVDLANRRDKQPITETH